VQSTFVLPFESADIAESKVGVSNTWTTNNQSENYECLAKHDLSKSFLEGNGELLAISSSKTSVLKRLKHVEDASKPAATITVANVARLSFVDIQIVNIFAQHQVARSNIFFPADPTEGGLPDFFVVANGAMCISTRFPLGRISTILAAISNFKDSELPTSPSARYS